jgi:hypothetical protein
MTKIESFIFPMGIPNVPKNVVIKVEGIFYSLEIITPLILSSLLKEGNVDPFPYVFVEAFEENLIKKTLEKLVEEKKLNLLKLNFYFDNLTTDIVDKLEFELNDLLD